MVVSLHQGEVFAESLEGVGSTFIVRLPVRASTLSARLPDPRKPGIRMA
jgi:signal transduction histidine kinase